MQNMEEIYKEYFETVKKYLFCLTHNNDIAEELTQETFYKAINNIHKFKEDCKISVWLCKIAKNTWLDNSFSAAMYSKVEKIKFRNKECYLVRQYLWEYIIEADTGILLRIVSEYEDEAIIQEYYKEIGNVQDSDVTRPDTTGYTEK